MRRVPSALGRRGFMSIWTLVILSALTAVLGTVTWQLMATRRALDQRQHQLQAQWLARSGVERAAARLLGDPAGYEGETVELIPGSRVRIEVRAEEGSPGTYRVTSEARYPAEGPGVVVRSETRRLRRVAEGDRVRVEGTDAR